MHRNVAASRWRTAALLGAIVGIGASAYLLVEYVTGQPGVCLTGSGCDLVRASAFAYPLGIPTPFIGLVFYLLAGWLVVRTIGTKPIAGIPAPTILVAVAVVGAGASLFLTAMEAFVIRAFCSWCLVQAAASMALVGASIGVIRTGRSHADDAHSSRARHEAVRAVDAERAQLHRTGRIGGGLAALVVVALLAVGAGGGSPITSGGSSLAPPDSPRLGAGAVEVVEFADFQCPGCAAVAPVLASLAAADEMTLVYRYFPLDTLHPNADASARAAAAADRQAFFWPISEALYARQGEWKDLSAAEADAFFAQLAADLGLDQARWQDDYDSADVEATVEADRQASRLLGLNQTPTLFIAGKPYDGALSLDGIRAAIAAAT